MRFCENVRLRSPGTKYDVTNDWRLAQQLDRILPELPSWASYVFGSLQGLLGRTR